MLTTVELKQIVAFARQDGVLLALVWVASFLCLAFGVLNVSSLLLLSTPFVVFWRLRVFRREVLGGTIGFGRAFLYCLYLCMDAAILFAVVQFFYFQIFDHGRFDAVLLNAMAQVVPVYEQNGISMSEMNAAMNQFASLTAIQRSMLFLFDNFFVSIFIALIVALCGMKTKRAKETEQ